MKYLSHILLSVGWFCTVILFVIAYPKVEVQLLETEKQVVVKECDYVCAPAVDTPQFSKCEFDYSYIAVKDSLYFDKGDIFRMSGGFYTDYDRFCPVKEESHSSCISHSEILESGFFAPYK